MKYFEPPFIKCPYCDKISIKQIGACCNIHDYLYKEKCIELAKVEGRYKNDYS